MYSHSATPTVVEICCSWSPRQQYLARKYCSVWGRRTFGSLLPSAARRHYCLQLKKRVFGVWNELWWKSHREWKLNIRADCHNRSLFFLCFFSFLSPLSINLSPPPLSLFFLLSSLAQSLSLSHTHSKLHFLSSKLINTSSVTHFYIKLLFCISMISKGRGVQSLAVAMDIVHVTVSSW